VYLNKSQNPASEYQDADWRNICEVLYFHFNNLPFDGL
jgi:hypothetical protein